MSNTQKQGSKAATRKPSGSKKTLADLPAEGVNASASQVKGGGTTSKFVRR